MKPLAYYSTDGFFWFRLFGVGLVIKDTRKHSLTFSERHGYSRIIKMGNYAVGFLPERK